MSRTGRPCIFWNLQRFFDPSGLPVARSLHSSSRTWTLATYQRKLHNVSTCLKAATQGLPPAFMGFAEVESLRILQDIREATGWESLVIVDELLPDSTIEGLDVALMFDGNLFQPDSLQVRSIALDNRFETRDLLQILLREKTSAKEVMVAVAHWPSRIISEGRILRFAYSLYVRRLITNILKFSKSDLMTVEGDINMPAPEELLTRWNIPCIVMGDFNDEPFDVSMRDAMGTTRYSNLVKRRGKLTGKSLVEIDNYLSKDFILYNPCWETLFTDSDRLGGTYYRSEWRIYDQVIFSHGALREDSCLRYARGSAKAFRSRETLGDAAAPVEMTTRSGFPAKFSLDNPDGVSDHLPLVFQIQTAGDEES